VLLGALFAGLTVAMLRPTWNSLDRTLPDLDDPALYVWSLSWGWHALLTQPLHLFSANIFWPHPLTWAYTDNLLILVVPFGVVRGLGGSWALALNLMSLAALVVSQAATYVLARWLTGRAAGALLAAIAFTFSSFLFAQMVHLQLMLYGLFPLCFYCLFRMLEGRSLRWAALFGGANVAMLTGALYYAAIYGICVAVIGIGWVLHHRHDLDRRILQCVAVAGAVTSLAIPTLVPYVHLHQSRPLLPSLGLRPADLVTVSPGNVLYPGLDQGGKKRNGDEHTFFPGFSTAVLALVGLGVLALGGRRRRRDGVGASQHRHESAGGSGFNHEVQPPIVAGRTEYLWLLVAAASAAVLLALGPEVHGVTMPFRFFHDHVPGFANIRFVARLAIPAMLTGAVLAAVGFNWITTRLRPSATAVLAIAVGAFMVFELVGTVRHQELPTDAATLAVYRELSHRGSGAVLELPLGSSPSLLSSVPDGCHLNAFCATLLGIPFVESPRMVYSTIDWHPRFNGYSGAVPPDSLAIAPILNSFPSQSALQAAQRLKLRYVILHIGPLRYTTPFHLTFQQYTDAQAKTIVGTLPPGTTAGQYGNSWLIDLHPR